MSNALSPAIFIDRDGTIMQDCVYCSDPKKVRIFPGVPEALRRLKSNGFKLIIITNQSGIGRGLFTLDQYRAVEAEVLRQIGDGLIDATYFCSDVPGQPSTRRKPEPGMILDLMQHWPVRREGSFVIGDRPTDLEAARAAGLPGFLFEGGDLDAFVADVMAQTSLR